MASTSSQSPPSSPAAEAPIVELPQDFMDSAVIKWVNQLLPLDRVYTDDIPDPPEGEQAGAYSLGLRVLSLREMVPGLPQGRVEWGRLQLMRLYSEAYRKRMEGHISDFNKRNLCMICLADLGLDNPRQLCAKTYCVHEI
jgi:hypothetical protein